MEKIYLVAVWQNDLGNMRSAVWSGFPSSPRKREMQEWITQKRKDGKFAVGLEMPDESGDDKILRRARLLGTLLYEMEEDNLESIKNIKSI